MKIAIVQYSTYGHITTLARAIKEGVEKAGVASQVDILQLPETLPQEVLEKMYAPPKPTDIKVATAELVASYDALILGLPTRFGTAPAQWSTFWDTTGGLWAQGALHGKPTGLFTSTGTVGGGHESTVRHTLSVLAHHGMVFVPMGYPNTPQLRDMSEVHAGTSAGSGAYAGPDGSRQPSDLELQVARIHGETFAKTAAKFGPFASSSSSTSTGSTSVEEKVAEKPAPKRAPVQRTTQAAKTSVEAEQAEKSGCSKCVIM